MTLLSEQATKRDALTLYALIKGIEAGEPLSKLFRQQKFHPLVPAMTLVGEESGDLARAFGRLGDYFRHRFEWKQKLIGSLVYPAVVAVVMTFVTIFVLYGILPRFESMYGNLGFPFPAQTKSLFAIASQLRMWFPWLVLAVCLIGFLPFLAKRFIMPRFPDAEPVILAVPGIRKAWRVWMSYRLADSIAVLTGSGLPLLHALETCERTARFSLERNVIGDIKQRILQGGTLTEALRSQRWIDIMLVHAVHAAEASGDLAGVCGFAAQEFEADLQRLLQRIVQLAEPAIIVGLGLLIGFVVLAVVLPMMQMVQSI